MAIIISCYLHIDYSPVILLSTKNAHKYIFLLNYLNIRLEHFKYIEIKIN